METGEETALLREPLKAASDEAVDAELEALRRVYDNVEVPLSEEDAAARRRDAARAFVAAVAVAVVGWLIYYSYGSVAVFGYGIVVSASHYAYCRVFMRRGPHPLTTLAFCNCLALVVVYAAMRTKRQRDWLVVWNGVLSGFATAALVVAFAALSERPAAALGFDEDYLAANPHVDETSRVALLGLGVVMCASNGLGVYLIAACGVDPNAPVYSSVATVVYNWCGLLLTLLWAAAVKAAVAPALEKRHPKRSFVDFLAERKRRRLPRRTAAPDPPGHQDAA